MIIREIIARTICDWFHGGGHVKRDASGRINWQCDRCGRWADPVSEDDERVVVRRAIAERPRTLQDFKERGR